MSMKVILCYGDSNTWGYNPADKQRFPADVRWPGVLRKALADGYLVLEEGLNGRTTVFDDPVEPGRNGMTYLMPCLLSHRPIDLVVLLLGTNDMKKRFSLSAQEISQGIELLVKGIKQSESGPQERSPKVLLLAPAPIARLSEFGEMFSGAATKSRQLAQHYRTIAAQHDCDFLSCGDIIASSDTDGIHLEAGEHRKLGLAVAENIRKILHAA
jgi:lysophospholipase L1-like esterase